MTVEKINKWCDKCPHVACETCQITWTDIEELKKDIKDNYISKDKIREKREQEEKLLKSGEPRGAYGVIKYREGKIQAYKELLEEE